MNEDAVDPDKDTSTVDVVVDEDSSEGNSEEVVVVEEAEVDGRDYRVEGNDTSGYVGVSPEYMTYANPTEKPILTDVEKWDLGLLDELEGNMDEDEKKDEEKTDDEVEETDENKSEETSTQPSHNAPAGVPGVITPTV